MAWRLARRWLEHSLPANVQPEIISDLFEDFGSLQGSGWLRAEAWVLIQAWSVARTYRNTWRADRPPARRIDELPMLLARLCRHALRGLSREPAYAAAVIVTLAIGIGSTTAVYSVVQQALLDPLPYPNASRLWPLPETRRDSEISISYLDFEDWQKRAQSFDALALFSGTSFTLPGTHGAERVRADFIGPGLLHLLGTTPALGRSFAPAEETVGGPHVALVTYGLWRRHFGGDPNILARRLLLDGGTFAIVRVLPQGFDFPSGVVYPPADIYLPLGVFVAAKAADIANRSSHPGLEAIALLRLGVAVATARAEMTGIATRLRTAYPGSNREVGVVVHDAVSAIVGDLRGQLVLVQAGVVLLLLLACVNAAGLALTRITSRAHQNAIAVALGAPIWQLTLAQLIELAIAAGVGGAIGCGLAAMTLRLIEPLVADLPRLNTLSVSWRMAGAGVALSSLSCLACSILPALRTRRITMEASLRHRGGGTQIGIRRVLTVAQIALALVLLLGAGALAQSLIRFMADDGGLKPDGVLTFDIRLPSNWVNTRTTAFFADLYQRLRLLPGVTAVGGISVTPFSGGGSQSDFEPVDASQYGVRTDVNVVTPDYFRAQGIPILRGRGLTPMDGAETQLVAVEDDWFATRFWPGASPIGQHIRGWGFSDLVVVGVVGHVKNYGTNAPSREELYVPLTERPRARLVTALRSVNPPAPLTAAVRQTVAELDRSVAIANVETMRQLVDDTIAGPRIASLLGVAFAASAMALALVALSGLMSYLVDPQRREMGTRLALGAKPVALVMHVMAGAARLTLAGTAVGVLAALVLLPLARSQMPSLGPAGYLPLFLAPTGFLVVAILACWLPARRAAGVPLTTVLED